ncbi:MAG TPA: apolipoprotein N-acyltransferase, partial [Pyrinomonadaceae bacterium]|nr:apolipoprotein N-acyltransferase [Pyrinomonadaceae bacterium]
MSEVLAAQPPIQRRRPLFLTSIRESAPSLREFGLVSSSSVLLVLSFPNFELWSLAWIGLAPLLFAVATTSRKRTAFVLGLIWGTIFFYGTCWWLTHPMIHFAGVAPWVAYPLLLLPVVFVSIFPAVTCACIARLVNRFGNSALLAAPLVWIAFDWLRQAVTGLDWNALGYSQAFHPSFIHPATLGGVYAVTFLIVLTNGVIAFAVIKRSTRHILISIAVLLLVGLILFAPNPLRLRHEVRRANIDLPQHWAVAIQPNVPMSDIDDSAMRQLLERHLILSAQGFASVRTESRDTRLLIWPESPMNFSYSRDPQLQAIIGSLARAHRTYVLPNSLEPAPNGGSYNSAILINEQGQKIAQYDKIRLMPFGEYVPLPRWLPGSGSVRSIVGEFTPGSSHTLMPLGALRAGVFICIEAAHADVARAFTKTGADVLINISNDGYLGPTAVMRQHLANAVFRAVENDRNMIRVTNSGISAYISSDGPALDPTPSFQEAVRTWIVSPGGGTTFYSRYGDVLAYGCALITLGFISATFMSKGPRRN